jgi:hypothetical protein
LRAIAERTGRYDGQDEPEFEFDKNGFPVSCKVRVYRKDISRPFVGVAYFREYAQTKKDGSLTNMWGSKPRIMVAKCAEALAFRKGFPEDTAGLYIAEEEGDEKEERELNATPAQSKPSVSVSRPEAPALPAVSRTEELADKLRATRKPELVETKPSGPVPTPLAKVEAKLSESVEAMRQIQALGEKYGFTGQKMKDVLTESTGRANRSQVTLADVAKVEAALDALSNSTVMKPPDDPEPPLEDAPF